MASYFKRVVRPCIRNYLTYVEGKSKFFGSIKLFFELLKPDGLSYPDMVCVLTTYCSLRCKYCNNLMPCYEKPYHVPADEAISDINTLLSHTDHCIKLVFLGGEIFLYPELIKVIDAVKNHPKVMCLSLVTNATVIPGDEIMDLIASIGNARISISDYGVSTQKVEEFTSKCREKGIRYQVNVDKSWRDAGGTENRGKDIPQLTKEYNECFSSRYCHTLQNGKIYTCARAASLADLGFMDDSHDSFDVRKPRSDKEFRRELREFFTLDYADACNYCDHGKNIAIPAGEQL